MEEARRAEEDKQTGEKRMSDWEMIQASMAQREQKVGRESSEGFRQLMPSSAARSIGFLPVPRDSLGGP